MTNKERLHNYYHAWVKNQKNEARSFLADDLRFTSPMDSFDGANTFMDKCWGFAENFNEVKFIREIYDDEQAFIMYLAGDGQVAAQTLVAEYLFFKNEKLVEIDVVAIKPYAPSAH